MRFSAAHAMKGIFPRGYQWPGISNREGDEIFYSDSRPGRAVIQDEGILRVIAAPEREHVQADGRVRRWGRIDEMDGRYLHVILLPDGETVHNAFFDRGYKS